MIVDRRLLPHVDWPLLGALAALVAIGLSMVYSTRWDYQHNVVGHEFWTQLSAVALSVVALVACATVDYRSLAQKSLFVYGAVVLLLVYVGFFGAVHGGSRRWIPLHGVNLQPSEFARVGLALVLAMYYGEGRSARSARALVPGALLLVVPLLLIKREPDLGTAVTLIPVFVGIVFLAGMRMKWVLILACAAVLLSPIVYKYGLTDYQRGRVETFVDPFADPHGAGYQQIQTKITVGSGGLTGKGFGAGTQGGYGFLPAASTDFIFASLAEEHGFLGVLVTLGLYLFVILRSLDAARLAKDRTGAYLAGGLAAWFAFQVVYNITMCAGLAPVKGLTLPLMSYGGSSLMATLAGFGLILNVRMRRFTN